MLKIKSDGCLRINSLILFFLMQLFFSTSDAQTISVNFNVLDSSELSTSKYFKKEQLKYSFELENLLRKKRIEWIDKGFFLVSFEAKKQTESQFTVQVELGRKFKKITVELEEKENKRNADAASNKPLEAPILTPEENMKIKLKKAKQDKSKEAVDMTVH